MASAPLSPDQFGHHSKAALSAAPEHLDISSKILLFDIFRTLQRLDSHMQSHHERLSLIEMSVRAESITASFSSRSGGSLNSGRRQQRESPITTPPQSPVMDYEASIRETRRKFEFEDEDDYDVEASNDVGVENSHENEYEHYVLQDNDMYSLSNYSRPLSRMLLERASHAEIPRIPSRSPLRPVSSDARYGDQLPQPHAKTNMQEETPFSIPYHDVTSQLMVPKPVRPVTILVEARTKPRSRKRDHIFLALEKSFDLWNKYIASIKSISSRILKQVETASTGARSALKTGTNYTLKPREISVASRPWNSMKQKVKEADWKSYMYRNRPYQVA